MVHGGQRHHIVAIQHRRKVDRNAGGSCGCGAAGEARVSVFAHAPGEGVTGGIVQRSHVAGGAEQADRRAGGVGHRSRRNRSHRGHVADRDDVTCRADVAGVVRHGVGHRVGALVLRREREVLRGSVGDRLAVARDDVPIVRVDSGRWSGIVRQPGQADQSTFGAGFGVGGTAVDCRSRSVGIDYGRRSARQRGCIAGRIGGGGADRVCAVGQHAGRDRPGSRAAGIARSSGGCFKPDFHAVGVQADQRARFGRAGEDGSVVGGNPVTVREASVGAGRHRWKHSDRPERSYR